LRTRHPDVHIECIPNVEGGIAHRETFSNTTNREKHLEIVAKNLADINQKLDKANGKEKWALEKVVSSMETEYRQILTDNYGTFLSVRSTNGKDVFIDYFPIMGFKYETLYHPDTRDVNDNAQRAIVKSIAKYTGIGARLYNRGDGVYENGEPTTRTKLLKGIYVYAQELGAENIGNYGLSIKQLKTLYEEYKLAYETNQL
jgi:hypothetical protein